MYTFHETCLHGNDFYLVAVLAARLIFQIHLYKFAV